MVFVVKFDDGTQQTLTPHEFEDRFRNEFPTDFQGITTHQARNTLNLTVVGTDGRPIKNARVFRNHAYTPISNQLGTRRFENAIFRTNDQGRGEVKLSGTPHDLRLWVSAPDHLTMHSMWAKDLDPDGGEVPEAFTVILSKAQRIGGVVRNKNAEPLANAEVKIRVTGESWESNKQTPVARPIRLSQTASAITDEDGRWTCKCAPSVALRQTEEQRETERERTQDYRIKITATSEVEGKRTFASQQFELQTLLDQKAELRFSD